MSSANVDKAQQIRPPIAIYVLPLTGGGSTDVFQIPGVPMDITGQAPEGAHAMLVNFISVQNSGANPMYIRFSASPSITIDPADDSPNAFANNPAPAPDGGLLISPGETVRYDLSQLFEKGAGNARVPVEYLGFTGTAGDRARVWRSSGR